ncbi:MAG: uroporphyrinogen decarboxylase family protein [Eubacteriales bacterium]
MDFIGKKLNAPLLGAPGTKLTSTTLKENLLNSDIQFDSLSKLYEKFEPDIMLPFMELTVEADTLGMGINFPENDNPAVKEHKVSSLEDFESVVRNYNGISKRMKVFVDVINKMSKNLPSSVNNLAYVIGPLTLVGELMGVEKVCMATVMDPDFVKKQLDFSIKVISDYSNALIDAGADGIVVLEPTAMLLSPPSYAEFSLNPFKELLDKANSKNLILHICGNTKHLVDGMCETGTTGLSLDAPMDFEELKKQVPGNIALIGNVDPVNVMLTGTPEKVESETKNLISKMSDVDNFILSTGCDLPMETPMENIEAFMKIAKKWKNNSL